MPRLVESCPFREQVSIEGDAEGAHCRLLREITGLNGACSRVSRHACEACCVSPEPSHDRLNPVLGSLLSKLLDDLSLPGGNAGLDPKKLVSLRTLARRELQMVMLSASPIHDTLLVGQGRGPSVSVVIPCHNYGRFLADAIESVLQQSARATEIVVVDDASDDDTESIARRYTAAGIRYLRVDFRSVFQARKAGLEATAAEIVCFLDADDVLPHDYLEQGLSHFDDPYVGVVYSDMQLFGDSSERCIWPADTADKLLETRNLFHAGSLVRRRALEIAEAFRPGVLSESHADWLVWRRVLEAGWRAVKQSGVYRYRRHPESMLHKEAAARERSAEYFDLASLASTELTIFTPFSGRAPAWDRLRDWLDNQSWPRQQCRLVFMDTSRDSEFGRILRRYLAESAYSDTHYLARAVGEPGLADKPRREFVAGVRLACARIYNMMARGVTTPYMLVIEDDVIPPYDVIERLLRSLDPTTAAVTAAYRSRFDHGYVVWDDQDKRLPPGVGVEAIGGSGFGCVLLRRAVLDGETFGFGYAEPPDYDHAFFRRLRARNWIVKVDWSIQCEHLG